MDTRQSFPASYKPYFMEDLAEKVKSEGREGMEDEDLSP